MKSNLILFMIVASMWTNSAAVTLGSLQITSSAYSVPAGAVAMDQYLNVLTFSQPNFILSDINGNELFTFSKGPYPTPLTQFAMSPDSLFVCGGTLLTQSYYIMCKSRTSVDVNYENFLASPSWLPSQQIAFDGKIVISEDKSTIAFYTTSDYKVRWMTLTDIGDGTYKKVLSTLQDPKMIINPSIEGFYVSSSGKYIGYGISTDLVIVDTVNQQVKSLARSGTGNFAMSTSDSGNIYIVSSLSGQTTTEVYTFDGTTFTKIYNGSPAGMEANPTFHISRDGTLIVASLSSSTLFATIQGATVTWSDPITSSPTDIFQIVGSETFYISPTMKMDGTLPAPPEPIPVVTNQWINGVQVKDTDFDLSGSSTIDRHLSSLTYSSSNFQLTDRDGTPLNTIARPDTATVDPSSFQLSDDSLLLIAGFFETSSPQLWYASRQSVQDEFNDFVQFALTGETYDFAGPMKISKDKSTVSYLCNDNKVRWAKLAQSADGTYQATFSTTVDDSIVGNDNSAPGLYASDDGNLIGHASGTNIKMVDAANSAVTSHTLSAAASAFTMSTHSSSSVVLSIISNNVLAVYSFEGNTFTELSQTNVPTIEAGASLHMNRDGSLLALTQSSNVFFGVIVENKQGNLGVSWSNAFSSENDVFKIQDDFGFYLLAPSVQAQADLTVCLNDLGSTGRALKNGQCQCLIGYYWNSKSQSCKATCNTRFASAVSESDDLQCDCEDGTAWDSVSRTCVIDCNNTQDATGQWLNEEVCQCNAQSVWNSSTLSCRFDCRLVAGSTGLEVSPGVCECPAKTKWDADSKSCVPDCDTIPHASEDTDGSCICDTGFTMTNGECLTTDCSVILFNDGSSASPEGDCGCQAGFNWVREFRECVIECLDTEPLNTGENAGVHECQCETAGYWNTDARMCYRNCDLVSQATGNADENSCTCSTGYTWVAENIACLPECLEANGEASTRNQQGFCDCLDGFTINPFENKCYRDCSQIENAKIGFGPSALTCYCNSGFSWDTDSCALSCQGPFDTQAKETVNAVEQCVCEPNTVYSASLHTCELKCTLDPLAKGYDPVNHQCICKAHAEWMLASSNSADWTADTNSCVCSNGYEEDQVNKVCTSTTTSTAAIIAVSSVLASGLSVFAGMKVYQKRKNSKVQEEQVQIDEKISQNKAKNSESAKDLEQKAE